MSHNHHDHGEESYSDSTLLSAVVVNLGLSVFEFIAGLLSGSIALMADALHNTNDAGALLIAYIARRISRKKADDGFTFGYQRAELIGAIIQLTALILVGIFLLYEAIQRFFLPEPLNGVWVMAAAGVALLVDLITVWLLWAMSKGSLNVRAAFLHNLTDAGASVAVLVGGAAIYWLNWIWVDSVITLIIASYILYISFGLLKKTSKILMQATPEGIDLSELKATMLEIKGVDELHDLHVWDLDEKNRALETHIVIQDEKLVEMEEIKSKVKNLLKKRYNIEHAVLEFETDSYRCTKSLIIQVDYSKPNLNPIPMVRWFGFFQRVEIINLKAIG